MAETVKKKKMTVEVVTPYNVFYEGRVTSIVIPTLDGQFGVLPGHSPLVVAITPGIVRIEEEDDKKSFVISEGFAEIGQNAVIIVCNAAEWPEKIDTVRAKEALERAMSKYNNVTSTEQQRIYARHAIRRAKARIAIVEEWKKSKKDKWDQ